MRTHSPESYKDKNKSSDCCALITLALFHSRIEMKRIWNWIKYLYSGLEREAKTKPLIKNEKRCWYFHFNVFNFFLFLLFVPFFFWIHFFLSRRFVFGSPDLSLESPFWKFTITDDSCFCFFGVYVSMTWWQNDD